MPKLPVPVSFGSYGPSGHVVCVLLKPNASCRLLHVSASLGQNDAPATGVIDIRKLAASPTPSTLRIRRVDPTRYSDTSSPRVNDARSFALRPKPYGMAEPWRTPGTGSSQSTRKILAGGVSSIKGRKDPGRLSRDSSARGSANPGRGESGGRRDRAERSSGGENYTDEGMLHASLPELRSMLSEIKAAEKAGAPTILQPKIFEVAEVSAESLAGNGPAIPSGQWGMSEVISEKLDRFAGDFLIENATRIQDLARRLRDGHFVRFRDEAEKEAVFDLVRNIEAKKGNAEEKDDAVPDFEPIPEEARNAMTSQLLQGSYKFVEKDAGPLQELLIKVRRNETISPKQEGALVRKIRSLMPIQTTRLARIPKTPV